MSRRDGRTARVLELKAAVRKRDGYRCVDCGMTNEEHRAKYGRTLEVHRLIPGTPYHIDTAVTLCKPCHAKKPRIDYPQRVDREAVKIPSDLLHMIRIIRVHTVAPHGRRPKISDVIEQMLRPAVTQTYEEVMRRVVESARSMAE